MAETAITGGMVYNHTSRTFSRQDITIDDGRITAIGTDLTGDNVIDASDQFVTPGLIDLHCHIFNHPLFSNGHPKADRIGVGQGVTALLDTGSAGPTTIDAFKEFVIDTQETNAFALCNVGSPGLPGIGGGHASRPELISLAGTVKAIERNPSWILGVKVLASSSHTGPMGIEAIKIGRKAASLTNTPLMVHIGNAPPVLEDILELLRPGDILTHAYHGKIGGVLGYGDKVLPELRDAVDRGVLIDIAHGQSSFAFHTAETAMDQGMPVHSISSDLHGGSLNKTVFSLARTMSKFRLLGMSLEDVVHATTLAPASAVHLDARGFGKLEVGGPAHISIFRETDAAHDVTDSEGDVRTTRHWIEPTGCLVNGRYHPTVEPL